MHRSNLHGFFKLIPVLLVCTLLCGCSRGYISSYDDYVSRSRFSMTAVSADFSGFTSLYAEDFGVPGEGEALDIGTVYAHGLFDMQDGRTLYEENITDRLYPASTTKIMTALLAIKYGNMNDVLVARTSGSELEAEAQRIGIEKGDRMTLDQALHYLMVYSANDAAILIAENIASSVSEFVDMMNREAALIGATNTHFVNPHGLHDKDHYTTAYDLFLIFRECIQYPEFRELISNDGYYSSSFKDRNGETRYIEIPSTDNYLTGAAQPPANIQVIGGKTGTTDQAGACLIILSKNENGREFVSVILGAPDHAKLYTYMNRLLRQERGIGNDG